MYLLHVRFNVDEKAIVVALAGRLLKNLLVVVVVAKSTTELAIAHGHLVPPRAPASCQLVGVKDDKLVIVVVRYHERVGSKRRRTGHGVFPSRR